MTPARRKRWLLQPFLPRGLMSPSPLLSLSVFIDEIISLKVSALQPAIAFRLADYPTVLVRPSSTHMRFGDLLGLLEAEEANVSVGAGRRAYLQQNSRFKMAPALPGDSAPFVPHGFSGG